MGCKTAALLNTVWHLLYNKNYDIIEVLHIEITSFS